MDKVDKKIIQILQKNARTPVKEIAEEVFLSSPAVSSRIEKMTEDGLIKGYHMDVDLSKLGYDVTAFIQLEIAPSQKSEFYPFIQKCPHVMECSCVTGQYSQLMKVAFRSMAELESFLGTLQQFGRTITHIVFSTPVAPRDLDVFAK